MKTFILLLSLLVSPISMATEPDWTAYQAVLKNTQKGLLNNIQLTLVNYQALKSSQQLAKAYQVLTDFDIKQLTTAAEKRAFYINAYNILALKMIVDHWPVNSIKDLGHWFNPVWDKPAGRLAGKTVTLGEIEHQILRKMNEPRIHFAIVCASVSCPDLRNQPYTAAKLDQQLDSQVIQFLNNSGKGLRIDQKVIQVSKIFAWFEADFADHGGVKAFIHHYKIGLPDLKIVPNLAYDWHLNGINQTH